MCKQFCICHNCVLVVGRSMYRPFATGSIRVLVDVERGLGVDLGACFLLAALPIGMIAFTSVPLSLAQADSSCWSMKSSKAETASF